MEICCLLENHGKNDCLGEHGLSLLLHWEGHALLFDMGASARFLENAARMGEDVADVEAAVLSHGHYDHGGGLAAFLAHSAQAPVYVRAEAFGQRGSLRPTGEMAQIGLDPALRENPRLRLLEENAEILPGALLFADVPHAAPLPQANGVLFCREGGSWAQDPFPDEQNLLLRAEGKTVLVTGCAHRGIVNIVRRARELAGGGLDAVIGGFHLSNPRTGVCEPEETLQGVLDCFAEQADTRFYTGHCTGDAAFARLQAALPGRVFPLWSGARIEV